MHDKGAYIYIATVTSCILLQNYDIHYEALVLYYILRINKQQTDH